MPSILLAGALLLLLLLLGLLGVLNGKAPDVKVVANIVDDHEGKVCIGSSSKGEAAPQVDVLHMCSKETLKSKERKVGVESSKEQRQEGDVEEREGLVGDVSGDHQADSVAKGETHVEDPRDQVLVDDLG